MPPSPEEMGYCDNVCIDEVGDVPVILFKQDKDESSISTVVVRGSTDNIMDDVERAVDDGVNNFKALTKVNFNLF
jgi:T-complex protein 1 subunit theta